MYFNSSLLAFTSRFCKSCKSLSNAFNFIFVTVLTLKWYCLFYDTQWQRSMGKKNVGFEAKSNSHSPFESLDNNKPNLKVTSQNEMGCVGDKNFLSV